MNYFKTFQEAWTFVHNLAINSQEYTFDKQAKMCEAFRMMYVAAQTMDAKQNENAEDINMFSHLLED